MNQARPDFDAGELCSRKLWQIVTDPEAERAGKAELDAAIAELAARRHYLSELVTLGKLDAHSTE